MAKHKAAEEKKAIPLLRKGRNAHQVARQLGVNPTTVQRWARKHGLPLEYPFNRHQLRDDLVDVRLILKLRRKKTRSGTPLFSCSEIAEIVECSTSYVKQVCRKAREDGRL